MAKVIINKELEKVVDKKFKKDSIKIFELFYSLEENPHKGKIVGQVGGLLIKELKYENFRFYFIVDGQKLRLFSEEELKDLLIRFVRMSDKKDQQKTIEEIRVILRKFEEEGF